LFSTFRNYEVDTVSCIWPYSLYLCRRNLTKVSPACGVELIVSLVINFILFIAVGIRLIAEHTGHLSSRLKLIRISWCCTLLTLIGLVGTRNWLFRLSRFKAVGFVFSNRGCPDVAYVCSPSFEYTL